MSVMQRASIYLLRYVIYRVLGGYVAGNYDITAFSLVALELSHSLTPFKIEKGAVDNVVQPERKCQDSNNG